MSLISQKFRTSACKDIEMRKIKFLTKTQFFFLNPLKKELSPIFQQKNAKNTN